MGPKRRSLNVTGTSLVGGLAAISTVTANAGPGYTDSTTALATSETYTGAGRGSSFNYYSLFMVTAFADVAGTVFIDQSLDTGATFQTIASAAVAAGTARQLVVNVTGNYTSVTQYRVRYVNGAAAQATFRLSSAFSAR